MPGSSFRILVGSRNTLNVVSRLSTVTAMKTRRQLNCSTRSTKTCFRVVEFSGVCHEVLEHLLGGLTDDQLLSGFPRPLPPRRHFGISSRSVLD